MVHRFYAINQLDAGPSEMLLLEMLLTNSELSGMQESVIKVEHKYELASRVELFLPFIDLLGTVFNQRENLLELPHQAELAVFSLHVVPGKVLVALEADAALSRIPQHSTMLATFRNCLTRLLNLLALPRLFNHVGILGDANQGKLCSTILKLR
jgi:hypothetical protein